MNQTEAMKQDKSLEEVRTIFADDRFATENGAMIEAIGDKYAKCSVTITDSHRNAMGAVMGGVYFKDGRTTACYRIDVKDNLENLVATVTTTGYHSVKS